MEPTNDDSSSDEDSEDSEDSVWTTEEENEIPDDVGNDTLENEANDDPSNDTPSNDTRVPGAAILTSFVPLQLVAHLGEGQQPVVVFDNELCNSPISGEYSNLVAFSQYLSFTRYNK